jgi:hypothetical protein
MLLGYNVEQEFGEAVQILTLKECVQGANNPRYKHDYLSCLGLTIHTSTKDTTKRINQSSLISSLCQVRRLRGGICIGANVMAPYVFCGAWRTLGKEVEVA